MPLDHYRTMGNSGLCVSAFALGAMTFGEASFGTNAAESRQILQHFIGRGGNFIDTANQYSRGRSEEIIGDYLRANSVRRDRLVIATKSSKNLHLNLAALDLALLRVAGAASYGGMTVNGRVFGPDPVP